MAAAAAVAAAAIQSECGPLQTLGRALLEKESELPGHLPAGRTRRSPVTKVRRSSAVAFLRKLPVLLLVLAVILGVQFLLLKVQHLFAIAQQGEVTRRPPPIISLRESAPLMPAAGGGSGPQLLHGSRAILL
eukprot:TRINITY_DN4734_c0_g1_i1.p1 TRINITY_DN4734_c0_g1~~TRINITY_DN4734_c0_g1_i1.p1  ORF type:complete len:132 (+),score=31.04 TRINITY_DN4734_c0_g1_i1:96-491(+)